MRKSLRFVSGLALAVVIGSIKVSESREPLAAPDRAFRTVSIENSSTPPWLFQEVAATDTGFVARQVCVPPGQSLPIQAAWSDDGKLVADIEGDSRVIAVHVKRIYDGDQRKIRNPLADMSASEIGALWGVVIDAWLPEMEQQLLAIDSQKVLITVKQDWHDQTTNPLPPLPNDIRYLKIDFNSSEGPIEDLSRLRQFDELLHFELDGFRKFTFDAELLSNCRKLEHLTLTKHRIENIDALASLTELRHLNLPRHRDNLDDLGFVAAMGKLETLDVSVCAATDLRSLVGLTQLKWVNADWTRVDRLSTAPHPQLRVLRVQSTKLSDDAVKTFARANPKCLVMHGWEDSIKNAISDANRLSVRASRFPISGAPPKLLFDTKDAEVITTVVDEIRIDESQSGFHCMCEGTPFLDFYRGDELLATVGFHHGRSLRWQEGWPGDAMLTRDSGKFLVDWLANHGVRGPRSEIEQQKQQQQKADRKLERAVAGLPKEVAAAFAKRGDEFASALRRTLPETQSQIAALLHIYGTDNNSWTQSGWIEQTVDAELKKYGTDQLTTAVESALWGDDRRRRRGAARFWRSWKSPLEKWKPDQLDELHGIAVQVMSESHYYPLRQDALQSLQSWRESFTEAEQTVLVDHALRDPHPSVRRAAMLAAGNLRLNSTAGRLMQVLRGEEIAYNALPDVPEDETIDVASGFDDVAGKREEKEVAALALGLLRYEPANKFISQQSVESPMFEVALALLGDYSKLKPIHFQLRERNNALQLAAVEVVLETRGAHGLKWATEYQQSQFWWEEDVVASWLAQMLVREKAPGADALRECRDLDVVVKWYQQHGDAYVRGITEN